MRKIAVILYIPLVLFLIFTSFKFGDFRSYIKILTDKNFMQAFKSTILIGVWVAIINLLGGILIGSYLARSRSLLSFILDNILSLPLIVPLLLIISFLHISMIRAGIVNNHFAVIIIHLFPSLPYSIKLCKAGYLNLGDNYYNKATMFGANILDKFIYISLPLLKSTFKYVFMLAFAISFGQYIITAIIGGGSVISLSMLYFPFLNSMDSSLMAAFSLIFILLPLLIWVAINLLYELIIYIARKL